MKRLLAFVLLVSVTFCAGAQNTTFTYQGRVTSSGTNFNGSGQFKFALVTSTNTSHQATATANMGGSSPFEFVNSYNIVNGGSGYVTVPAVTLTGGGGSGAAAVAVLTGGVVTSINIINPGSGYSSAPLVTIDAPPANIVYTTYWSNDGSSIAGSQPAAAVGVTAVSGLFTVVLGDSTLPNMTTIPAALFAVQPSLQLRIWFNDGVNGFGVLNPLQNLTPVPYASFALSASNVLGTVPAAQLSGPIPAANLSGSYGNVVTLGNANNAITGNFTGNGAGVTNISLGSVGPAGTFSAASGFGLTGTYPVGVEPTSVIALDVNGDGLLDLVTANDGDGTLTILTNNGAGGFGSNSVLTVGSDPFKVIATDINGDGKVDLLSADSGGFTVTIYTNNGSGVFSSNAVLNTVSSPADVVVMDVNNDGKPDLISVDYDGTPNLEIFTNNGSGVYGSNATIYLPGQVVAAIKLDVNNDGKLDLAVSCSGNSSVLIFTNNGAGSFGSNAVYAVGGSPYGILAADLNGDGKLDLVTANVSGHSLSILTNNGSGRFGSNATLTVSATFEFISVATADFNGDGKPDLITSGGDSAGNAVVIFTNNGSGVFSQSVILRVPGGVAYDAWTVDINGDGKTDIITANSIDNSVSIFENLAHGTQVGNGPLVAANFIGNGSGLTDLSADSILSGTLSDKLLSANVPLLNGINNFNGTNSFNNNANEFTGDQYTGNTFQGGSFNGGTFTGVSFTGGTLAGNGAAITTLNAGNIISGTLVDARLSTNVSLLNGNKAFTGSQTFSNSTTTFATGAGNLVIRNDAGVVPGLVATGGIVPGHVRFRNYLEIFPNDAQTNSGGLDVRNTNGSPTITLNGANGSIICSNVTASGVLLSSDRNVKEHFQTLDGQAVLAKVAALPITQWNYKFNDGGVRHIGPMAQDFHAAFGLDGADDKHISVVDEGGVALAAIQGLNQKVEEKDSEIQRLKQQNQSLETRLTELEQAFQSLAAKK